MSAEHITSTTVRVSGRGIAVWEIVSVATSCLIAQWAIQTLAGRAKWLGAIPIALALGLMVFSHRERGEGFHELGFRFDNFFAAARLLAIPTAIAIVMILFVSWQQTDGRFSLAGDLRIRLFFLPVWALFQQYALQGFINRRAQIAFKRETKSVLVVAVIFTLMHLPSPLLGALAFAGGYTWAWVYQRHPNLFALALSHSLVSLVLSLAIPSNLAGFLRIGFKYFG